jgi:hypothetical protein
MDWERHFALLPQRTISNRLVWLRWAERRWNWDLNPWCHDGWSGYDGGWEYRLPLVKM